MAPWRCTSNNFLTEIAGGFLLIMPEHRGKNHAVHQGRAHKYLWDSNDSWPWCLLKLNRKNIMG